MAKLDMPWPGSDIGGDRPLLAPVMMAMFHDEGETEDFQHDEDSEKYFYPCPCGSNFCITKEDRSQKKGPESFITVIYCDFFSYFT